jgi:radical SAM protein with 4Fe4S-binding SPASM domain
VQFDYVPQSCVWELTLKCNMGCIHCGSSAGKARDNELTIEECLDVADQLIGLGCEYLTLIGGEVFLYDGWEKIARRLSEGGVDVNIITNAYHFGDEQIDQIRYAKLGNVGISLDGMENAHNRIRNSKKSFQRVMNAFDRLNEENIPISVVTSLLDFNFYDLDAMHDVLAEKGIPAWQIQIANAMGSMAENRNLLLDPAKIPLITRFIREKRNELKVRIYAADDIGYYDENEFYLRNRPGRITVWGGCQAGLRVVGIDSVGNVKGCESLYSDAFIEGNLREESLKEIWTKEGNFAYNRNFKIENLAGTCEGCDRGPICRGGCRGSCYFTTGNRFENPYCCYPEKRGTLLDGSTTALSPDAQVRST